MIIRNADQGDFPAICELVASAEELFLVWPAGKFPLDIAQLEQLQQQRNNLTVVISNKKITGFANVYDVVPGEYAFIGNVIVSKQHRGKGIGKKLLAYMISTIFNEHANEVRISVFNFNTPALLLYSSLGFKPYAIDERKNLKGEKTALIHMKLMKEWRLFT